MSKSELVKVKTTCIGIESGEEYILTGYARVTKMETSNGMEYIAKKGESAQMSGYLDEDVKIIKVEVESPMVPLNLENIGTGVIKKDANLSIDLPELVAQFSF